MKIEQLNLKKNGKSYSGEIAWPDNLSQALTLLGEREVWEAFKIGYRDLAKKRITGSIRPRRKWAKIDLASLDDQTAEMISLLISDSLARARIEKERQAAENLRRVEQQTFQTDSAEKLEVAEAPSPESADDFETDLAKYLASLDSSPRQKTEINPEQAG